MFNYSPLGIYLPLVPFLWLNDMTVRPNGGPMGPINSSSSAILLSLIRIMRMFMVFQNIRLLNNSQYVLSEKIKQVRTINPMGNNVLFMNTWFSTLNAHYTVLHYHHRLLETRLLKVTVRNAHWIISCSIIRIHS